MIVSFVKNNVLKLTFIFFFQSKKSVTGSMRRIVKMKQIDRVWCFFLISDVNRPTGPENKPSRPRTGQVQKHALKR